MTATTAALRTLSWTLDDLRPLARRGQLYAVLDACDQPEVPEKAQEYARRGACSFYPGDEDDEFWDIAPYLFPCDEPLIDWIHNNLWDKPWGIFIVSRAGREDLLDHLESLTIVLDPEGEPMYFRYYDPRVLSVYLPTCTPTESELFFGPASTYIAPVDRSPALRAFRN